MVYCDPMIPCVPNGRWRWTKSCHMFSDNMDELHSMAARIGLKRSWFQDGRIPHYDLNEQRRVAAVTAGVIPLTRRGAVEFWRKYWPKVKPAEDER